MFLRKIFSSNNKLTWVVIDLFIVIIGVYCAFLIQSYSENEKTEKEKDKIYTALKYELETFRFTASQVALGVKHNLTDWQKKIDERTYHDYSGGRFIEPQYGYQIIEHSINIDNSTIIDFELYNVLQGLYVEIKKVEHTERLLTEVAMRYRLLPVNLDQESQEVQLVKYENFNNFKRYVLFTGDRGIIMQRIVDNSQKVLEILNERLSPAQRKKIEENLIRQKMPDVPMKERALGLVKQFFPDWSNEEIEKIFEEIHGTKKVHNSDSTSSTN